MTEQNLVIIGASVRAAAFSALRAGFQPWCADLFGDRDLRAHCPVTVLDADRYPHGFAELLPLAPPGPWMYTGALENRRQLIRRLAAERPLWGNDSQTLAIVRSPRRVHAILTAAGLPCPAVMAPGNSPPPGRRWLVKLRAGAAGVGIRFWDGQPLSARRHTSYLQEYLDGESASAVYAAGSDGVHLLGVTRQLVGEAWCNAGPFRYCGSVGPLAVPSATSNSLVRIGEALTAAAGLRGLFGIDFILRDGVPWPVEVNPRYTASVEVLEYATGLCALRQDAHPIRSRESVAGKAILFARRRITIPVDGPWMAAFGSPIDEMPAFADIPQAGQVIEKGRPILTIFARAADENRCLTQLRHTAADLTNLLYGESQ